MPTLQLTLYSKAYAFGGCRYPNQFAISQNLASANEGYGQLRTKDPPALITLRTPLRLWPTNGMRAPHSHGALSNTSLVIDHIFAEWGALKMRCFGLVSSHISAEWSALVCLRSILTSLPVLHEEHGGVLDCTWANWLLATPGIKHKSCHQRR